MSFQRKRALGIAFLIIVVALALWIALPRKSSARLLTASIPVAKASSAEQLDRAAVDACNAFGLELLKKLAERDPRGNVAICPPSMSLMLSMAYNGAGSTTKTGIAKALHLADADVSRLNHSNLALMQSLNTSGAMQVTCANALWADDSIGCRGQFLEACKSYYRANVWSLDLQSPSALAAINNWASENTKGRIKKIVDDLNPETALVLANAVCFDGKWLKEFGPPDRDVKGPFELDEGERLDVPFMGTGHELRKLPYAKCALFQSAGVPYKDERYRMYLFEPHRKMGLSAVLRSLSVGNWNRWAKSYHQTEIEVYLPLFQVQRNETDSLKASLAAMGMSDAFTPAADFSSTCSKRIWVDRIAHSVAIKVNKKGTEAAAVSSMSDLCGGPPPYPVVSLHSPFFYAICDTKSGLILFMGVVMNPARRS